jgi:predicted SnoaL-like aldol condensation-catalyzing enzyme
MSTPQAQTTTEQNKQIILRWFEEVWNQGRRETIAELYAPEGVLHDGAAIYRGREDFHRFYDELRSQFSKFQVKPIISLAEGDLVCLHWSAAFCHTLSDKALRITGTSVVRIKDGRFVEAWQNWDQADLAAQLAR